MKNPYTPNTNRAHAYEMGYNSIDKVCPYISACLRGIWLEGREDAKQDRNWDKN